MKHSDSRRIVPSSAIATVLFVLLFIIELLVICGILEVRTSTIERIAPWAYKPFTKLTGEHLDSGVQNISDVEEEKDESGDISGLGAVAGFGSDAVVVEVDTNAVVPEYAPLETETIPAATEQEEPTDNQSTNPPPAKPEDVVPVG